MNEEEIVLKRLKDTLAVLTGKNVITNLDFQIRNMVEDCIKVIEKQRKIINEMAKSIAHNNDIDYEICDNVHEKGISCDGYSRETNKQCEDCIKEYFTKKVEV